MTGARTGSAASRPGYRAGTSSGLRTAARLLLGLAMVGAGLLHLTVQRQEFQALVPNWFPVDEDLTVLASGIVEIALGAAFVVLPRRRRLVGALLAVFLVVVFPGNIAQYVEGIDAFGLDTDRKRLVRLFFQPLLVLWALYGGDRLHRPRPRGGVSRAPSGPVAARPGPGPDPPEAPNPSSGRGC